MYTESTPPTADVGNRAVNETDQVFSEEMLEDYPTSPVPDHRTVGGIRIGMVNGSLAFAVPGLITGLELGGSLGIKRSLIAFLIGGLFLAVVGSVTGIVGAANRLTSYMLIKFVFGRNGAKLVNVAFAIALFGWFGVNTDLFSGAAAELSYQLFSVTPEIWALEIGAGILITASTLLGFRLLNRMSAVFVPILFVVIVFLLLRGLNAGSNDLSSTLFDSSMTLGQGISAVVGSFIVAVVLMPDFTRFAKSSGSAVIASFLPFLLLSTFVYIAAAIAGNAVAETDALGVMLALGMGFAAFSLLILSSWITGVINLYSCSLCLNSVFPGYAEWRIVVASGIAGTIAASFDLLDSFTGFLFSLAIIFAPICGIYATDFFIFRRSKAYDIAELESVRSISIEALLAWAIGTTTAYLSYKSVFQLTSIEAADSIIAATLSYYFLGRARRNFG